jgi:hypothetical protein
VPEKPSTGSRRLFSRGATDTVVYLKALRGIGVAAIDIGFERIAAESSLAEVRWFRGGYYWTPHQNSTKLKLLLRDCFASLAMTTLCHCEERSDKATLTDLRNLIGTCSSALDSRKPG